MNNGAAWLEELSQVEKINGSHLLRDCEVLRQLLHFLAAHALQHPEEPPKEQEIAEHVFGQRSDFDPRLDSRVRVQIKRLRDKLSRYYEETGSGEKIILQIPPGTYQLQFLYRDQTEGHQHRMVEASKGPALRRYQWYWVSGAVLLGILIGWLLHGPGGRDAPDPTLKAFWNPFLGRDATSLVIYGNSEFYDKGGVLKERDGSMDGAPVNDSFTGVGEVIAATHISNLFNSFGHHPGFRRALYVNWEEAKNSNLLFIGSFAAAVKALPLPEKYAIRTPPSAPPSAPAGEVRTRILNLAPAPGEPAYFAARPSPCCRSTTEDHALIALSPGLSPNRVTLTLTGITTLGTQAAVEFVCRPSAVRKLLSRLPAGTKGEPAHFEAVIKVRISDGAPVQSEIVSVHLRRSDN